MVYIGYEKPGTGIIGMNNGSVIFSFAPSSIALCTNTVIDGSFAVNEDTILEKNLKVNGDLLVKNIKIGNNITIRYLEDRKVAQLIFGNGTNFIEFNESTFAFMNNVQIFKYLTVNEEMHIGNLIIWYFNGTAGLINGSTGNFVEFNDNTFIFGKNVHVVGNLTVVGTFTNNGSNTITHYAPIEYGEEIYNYQIGKTVFMSGKVYKHLEKEWVPSTSKDFTDCISSVKIITVSLTDNCSCSNR